MAGRKWKGKVLYDSQGNLEPWDGYDHHYLRDETTGEWVSHPKEWRDNEPFLATLRLVNYDKGRSAMRFIFEDTKGNTFPMFLKDFFELVPLLEKGATITRTWVVSKRGANYGIIPADAAEGQ